MRHIGNVVYSQGYQGFESLRLRQIKSQKKLDNLDFSSIFDLIIKKRTRKKDFHMIPDIKQAKELFTPIGFSPYSSTYIVTNEDLRDSLQYMPKNTDTALTVAASGDHPLFATLYGAKHVDTFDITFNAKLIMDIKTNALSLLKYKEYCQLLEDLHNCNDITSVKNTAPIIKNLNQFEQRYIIAMHGNALFNKENYIDPLSLPMKKEFTKLQKIIKEPFNFIWSDIQILHEKLTKNYDFMHLSNVLDYINVSDSAKILYTLTQHVNPGGIVCFEAIVHGPERMYVIYNRLNNFFWKDTNQSWEFCRKAPMLYVMRRVK